MTITKKPTRVVFLPEGRAAFEIVVLEQREGTAFRDVLHERTDAGLTAAFSRWDDDTGWEPNLIWLYEKLACSCVDMRNVEGGQLWFDDEGKLRGRPINPIATLLYAGAADPIVGHAVLVLDPEQYPSDESADATLEQLRVLADEAFFSTPKGS